jgi:glycosyltransferase involved in cell wall biosynthesis
MFGAITSPASADRPDRPVGGLGLVVVVPVRNEELRLGRCLTALDHARRRTGSGPDGRDCVRVVLVLDRCTDRSADIAATQTWIETVVTDHGRVGAARAAGVAYALSNSTHPLDRTWIACTDGDSAVPADWLQTHRAHAAAGTDLLLGTVCPDPGELGPTALRQWFALHVLAEGHRHVFGANLGIRAQTYLRAGGFADVDAHEDQRLATAVRRLHGRVVSSATSPVLTSGRTVGRTGAGFAEYLDALGREAKVAGPQERQDPDEGQPSRPEAPATEMAGGRT